jgi:hypothetical protein
MRYEQNKLLYPRGQSHFHGDCRFDLIWEAVSCLWSRKRYCRTMYSQIACCDRLGALLPFGLKFVTPDKDDITTPLGTCESV